MYLPDRNGADSMLSTELLSERRGHDPSALVGRSVEVLLAALARVAGNELVELHAYTLENKLR